VFAEHADVVRTWLEAAPTSSTSATGCATSLFLGEHQHTLDAKGRVILPARFRDRLASGLVFAPSQDRCIDVYPLTAFERRVEELRAVPARTSAPAPTCGCSSPAPTRRSPTRRAA
jgi:hypothetical protein